jgi:hypothetical protein
MKTLCSPLLSTIPKIGERLNLLVALVVPALVFEGLTHADADAGTTKDENASDSEHDKEVAGESGRAQSGAFSPFVNLVGRLVGTKKCASAARRESTRRNV